MSTSAEILAAAQAVDTARGPYNTALAAVQAADTAVLAAVSSEHAALTAAIDTARANLNYSDLQQTFAAAADELNTAVQALAAAAATYDGQ